VRTHYTRRRQFISLISVRSSRVEYLCWKTARFRKEYLVAKKKRTVTIDYIVLPRVSSCNSHADELHAWMRNRLISNALKHIAMELRKKERSSVPSARNNRSWRSILLIHLNILLYTAGLNFISECCSRSFSGQTGLCINNTHTWKHVFPFSAELITVDSNRKFTVDEILWD